MVISFCGQPDVQCNESEKDLLKLFLKMEIEESTADTFYLCNYGYFDELCFETLKELQVENPHIRLVCVYSADNANDCSVTYAKYCFDDVICPVINVPKSSAKMAKYKWMVDNSDIVATFFTDYNSLPGKIFHYAKRKNKSCLRIIRNN